MSIKIVPQEELSQNQATQVPALLFSNFDKLYPHRRERFAELAKKDHPLQTYFAFLANLAKVQQRALQDCTLQTFSSENIQSTYPLDCHHWQLGQDWLRIARYILQNIEAASEEMTTLLATLNASGDVVLLEKATALLKAPKAATQAGEALLLWAALSVYWRKMANAISHNAVKESGANLQHCPVCHSDPVASVVHIGQNQGLRYLHCALCETQWNVVRTQCTHCEQGGKINYYSLDSEFSAIRAETCGDCQHYLKIFYLEKDPNIDVMADDIATLWLDIEMANLGLENEGLNPYFFITETTDDI